MIMVIGFATMTGLVWVLADGMARESEAEKRRMGTPSDCGLPPALTEIRETLKEAA